MVLFNRPVINVLFENTYSRDREYEKLRDDISDDAMRTNIKLSAVSRTRSIVAIT